MTHVTLAPTYVHVQRKMPVKPRVEKELDRRNMTTMSLSFTPKLASTVDTSI